MSPIGKKPPPRRRSGALAPLPTPKPNVGDSVELLLPGGVSYPARAVRVEGDEVLLVLLFDARDPLKPGRIAAVQIEFTAPQGLVQLEGHGDVEAYDLVRFTLEAEVDVQQRRDFVRVQVVRPMSIAALAEDGTAGDWIDTLSVNLSGNGVLAAGPETLEIDTPVRFRLALVEGEPRVEGAGVVARITDEGQRGIAIRELGMEDRKRLVHFIFERERIARRLMRDGKL